jgi:hypothetical protein
MWFPEQWEIDNNPVAEIRITRHHPAIVPPRFYLCADAYFAGGAQNGCPGAVSVDLANSFLDLDRRPSWAIRGFLVCRADRATGRSACGMIRRSAVGGRAGIALIPPDCDAR